MSETTWIDGRPNAPGIWVLRMKNRALVAATVRWDEYDDDGAGGKIRRRLEYLRIDDGEMSEELDCDEGEIGRWVARSFGPIPWPSDPDVEAIIRQAVADTRKVASAEREGERIDGDTMEFVMRDNKKGDQP